jgi:excisionase family DNA binding protein
MRVCPSCPFGCLFTDKEAAQYLRLSKRQIKRYVDKGKLPYKTIGKRRRYRRRDLDQLLE